MLGRLEAQNSRKLQQRHGKIPSRSNSETNQTFTSKVEQIQQLKSEIQKLKQSKTNNILSKLKTQKQYTSKKKRLYGFQIRGTKRNQRRNIEGNDFYKTNNADSIGIQRKIKNMLEHRSDPVRNILNLSKHSLNTYKLLNKNLNFVPTPK